MNSAQKIELLHLAEVERAHAKLTALLGTLRVTNGHYTTNAMWEAVDALECLELAFQLDATESLDAHREELRIDAEGYRLNRDGDRVSDLHRPHMPNEAIREVE